MAWREPSIKLTEAIRMIYFDGKNTRIRLMHKARTTARDWFAVSIVLVALTCTAATAQGVGAGHERRTADFARIPLSFEANQGQTDREVKFHSRGDGYSLSLTSNAAILKLRAPAGIHAGPAVLRMELLETDPGVQIAGTDQLPGVVNYFIGSDPKRWHRNIGTYAKVRYEGIYPGVDAIFYGNQRRLEYDFVVAPGADASRIALGLSGVRPSLDAVGNVVLKTASGDLLLCKPVVYQGAENKKEVIKASYVIAGNTVRFKLGKYNHNQPLVIDPSFDYMTYLGGSGVDQVGSSNTPYASFATNPLPSNALAVDTSGNTYVAGTTYSSNFPTQDGYEDTWAGSNGEIETAFVSKINPAGTGFVYSTYLGGSLATDRDQGCAIAVDASGDAYVVGSTQSPDFPTTQGAYQRSIASGYSAFITELDPAGSGLVYSTFLGGPGGYAAAYGIAVDANNQAYVTGNVSSVNDGNSVFPTTSNALLSTINNFAGDGFVTVFDAAGTSLIYSTLIGDDQEAQYNTSAQGIAVDPAGNFYVTGITQSPNMPVTSGAFQTALGTPSGQSAYQIVAFAAKFGPVSGSGNLLTYLTYLRASGVDYQDWGEAITADSSGNAYVAGFTQSATFPATAGAYQTTCPDYYCAFITKLNPSGTALVWSTLLGDNGNGVTGTGAVYFVSSIELDVLGNVYVAGGASTGFPGVNPVQPNIDTDSAGFISKIDPTGSTLLFSSMLGDPTSSSWVTGLAVDALGRIYVGGGVGNGSGLPVTAGAPQSAFGGGQYDGWIAKIHIEAPSLTIAKSHTGNFTQGQTGATYTISVTNNGDAPTSGTVTVTEAVPAGLTLQSMSGTGWDCTALPTCTRTDALATSSSYPSIAVTVNVASDAPATLDNLAYVSGGGAYFTGNETASDATTVIQTGAPDMTVNVNNGASFVQGQMGAAYSIVASNSGTASSSGVVTVSDTVPSGLTLVSMTGTGWSCATLPVCTRTDSLAAGSSYPPITVTVNVASNAPASVTDEATVSGGGETNTANDTALDVTTVNGPPDLTVVKSHSGSFSQGQNGATYSITVGNAGTTPTSGTVTANEAIPPGLTLVSMSGTGWNCTALPACTRTDALAAGGNYPAITVTVNVGGNAPASVTNTATVSGGGESNTANDSVSDVTSIAVVIQSQTITFPPIATQTYPVAPITLNATASSGLTVSYSVTAGPAIVSGNILTITGGGSVTVQATQAGNASYSAATPVSQTFPVNQAPSITSANSTTFFFSTAGSFSIISSGYPAPSISETGALPGGITFINNGNGTGTLSGSPSAVGTFPISFTASNGVGSPATQSFSLKVSPASTVTTAQSASAAFSVSAHPVTLTATVTSTTGTVNSGTVTFTVPGVGTTTSGTVSGGTASATLTIPGGTVGGSYAIQAVYSGTTNLSSSSDSSKALTISGLASTTTGAAALGAHYSLSSQSVTLMAEVFVGGMANVNGGTVTFTVSAIGTAISGTVTNGQASATLVLPAGQAAGSYTITASYSGSSTYSPSSGTNMLNIFTASTTTTAQSLSVHFSSTAQTVTLNAMVTSPVGTVNGGIVRFTIGSFGIVANSGTVTGGSASAAYTIPAGTAPGVYPIQAIYEGTVSLNSSIDSTKTLTITSTIQATTTVAANASVAFSKTAQASILQASVSGGSTPINGGTFTFNFGKLGTATSGTVVNGSATATLTPPAGTDAGTYSGTVSYSGAPGFAPSSASASIMIVPAVPVITWPTPAAITYPTVLSSTQLDATISVPGKWVYSPAAGTVLHAGTQTLHVTFTPSNHVDYATTTAQVSLVVKKANTSLTIYVPGGDVGFPVFVTVQVTAPIEFGLGGTVTVQASTGESCTTSGLYYGAYFCNIVFNTVGPRTVIGTYSGDANDNPSVSAPVHAVIQNLGG